jgi:hypothetical protein
LTYPATAAAPETIATEVDRTSQGYPPIAVGSLSRPKQPPRTSMLLGIVGSFRTIRPYNPHP